MRNNKGQLTVMMIIGLVLLMIFTILFFIVRSVDFTPEIPLESKPLITYVDNCLESISINAVQLIGLQGGYTQVPEPSLTTDYSTIAYHYYEGDTKIPSKGIIESQISTHIIDNLDFCLRGLSAFMEQGYEIKAGEIKAETKINENEILIDLNYPLTIIKKDKKTKVKTFSTSIPLKLDYIHNIARLITTKTVEDPDWIDATLLSSFDVLVEIIPYNDSIFIYSITDEKYKIKDNPYTFIFANKFIINQAPILNLPQEPLVYQRGDVVNYLVEAYDAEDDVLTFSDDTAMFDITENGIILFTAQIPGTYDVEISVTDEKNNYDSGIIKFIIE